MSVPSTLAPAPLVPTQGSAPAATTRLDATAGSTGGQSHPSAPFLPPSLPPRRTSSAQTGRHAPAQPEQNGKRDTLSFT